MATPFDEVVSGEFDPEAAGVFTRWLKTYREAVDVLTEFFVELGQDPDSANNNARACLARLGQRRIVVEEVL